MKKISVKDAFESLKKEVAQYAATVRARRAVVHSKTAQTIVKNDIKGGTTLTVAELLTITRTSNALNKHVVLESDGDNLVINLVDAYPPIPYQWGHL